MASLESAIAAIISSINKGRSQADAAVLEIAEMYKKHPLLAEFPIPRIALSEVTIDLKVAINSANTQLRVSRMQSLGKFDSLLMQLVSEPTRMHAIFVRISEQYPDFLNLWQARAPRLLQELQQLGDEGIELRSFSKIAAAHVKSTIMQTLFEFPERQIRTIIKNVFFSDLENAISDIENLFEHTIGSILPTDTRTGTNLDVLITAAELESVPVEKITNIKINLNESDRGWTQYENEKGEVIQKLVPS